MLFIKFYVINCFRVSDIAGIENIGYDGRNNDSKPYINNKVRSISFLC